MANGADGSIVIDTQLDNTGFQRGSQQMQRAVNSLNNSVNQTGQNMNSAVQSMNTALQNMGAAAQSAGSKFTQYLGAGQFDRAMGEVQKSAQSLVSDLAKIGNAEAAGVKPGAQYQRLVTNIQDAERELATLKGQMDQMSGHTFETSEFTQLKSLIRSVTIFIYENCNTECIRRDNVVMVKLCSYNLHFTYHLAVHLIMYTLDFSDKITIDLSYSVCATKRRICVRVIRLGF